jgi:hypothetical protein
MSIAKKNHSDRKSNRPSARSNTIKSKVNSGANETEKPKAASSKPVTSEKDRVRAASAQAATRPLSASAIVNSTSTRTPSTGASARTAPSREGASRLRALRTSQANVPAVATSDSDTHKISAPSEALNESKPAPRTSTSTGPVSSPECASGERDPRLPPVGTKLLKRDRSGSVLVECLVEEGGFRYRGTLYSSLSAAASAAAKDLGVSSSVNGFVWFGLAKPTRPVRNAVDHLRTIADRFQREAAAYLARMDPPEKLAEVRREVEAHAARLADLLRPAA